MTPQKRRLHLIDKHKYPRNYDFGMVERGIDKRISALRGAKAAPHAPRRRVSEVGDAAWQANMRDKAKGQKGHPGQKGDSFSISSEGLDRTKEPLDHSEEDQPSATSKSVSAQERSATTSTSASSEVDTITNGLTSLQFVPLSVRLKHRKRS